VGGVADRVLLSPIPGPTPSPKDDDPMTHLQFPPEIDSALPVNDVVRRWPIALRILKAHGIDTCCRGALSLDVAARDVGVDVHTLISEIATAAGDVRTGDGCHA
jgi:hypothetical protein